MRAFTAEEVIFAVRDAAPEFRSPEPRYAIDEAAQARMFNAAISTLVHEVIEADDERLARPYTIPAEVVSADDETVDLTANLNEAEEVESGLREWAHINYIDAYDADGELVAEVYSATIADRHAMDEMDGVQVSGYLVDGYDTLRKLDGWAATDENPPVTLEVFGVLEPTPVTATTLGTVEFSFQRPFRQALERRLVVDFALHVGIADARFTLWDAQSAAASVRLGLESTRPSGTRVERLPPGAR